MYNIFTNPAAQSHSEQHQGHYYGPLKYGITEQVTREGRQYKLRHYARATGGKDAYLKYPALCCKKLIWHSFELKALRADFLD
jgi:hypothetical protein